MDLCGGDWALAVYFTGVRLVRTDREPLPTANIRIAFIMTIYGDIYNILLLLIQIKVQVKL